MRLLAVIMSFDTMLVLIVLTGDMKPDAGVEAGLLI